MPFYKSNLRTGDVMEFRNGRRFIAMLAFGDFGTNIGKEVGPDLYLGRWMELTFTEYLKALHDPNWDVVRVWRPVSPAFSMDINDDELSRWELVFERRI